MLQKTLSTIVIAFLVLTQAFSTHLKGGKISVDNLGQGLYQITVQAYLKTKGAGAQALFSNGNSGVLDFGDGTSIFLQERAGEVSLEMSPDGSIAIATVSVEHTFPTIGSYYITYTEANRDEGIINMANSVSTPFFLESFIVIDPNFENNGTAEILAPPILSAVAGAPFSYSMAAFSGADNTLYYSIVVPKQSTSDLVDSYKLPENFKINAITGLITWDGKFNNNLVVGEFAFAVRVKQVKNNATINYVTFDFQIVVTDETVVPSISDNRNLTNGRVYVPVDSEQSIRTFTAAVDEVYTDILEYANATGFPEDLIYFTKKDSTAEDGHKFKIGLITVKPKAQAVRNNPYPVVVRAKFTKDGHTFYKDLSYLIYTKDVEVQEPNVVTAVTQAESSTITIFPNPLIDYLLVETSNHKNSKVQLYNINGDLIIEKDFVTSTSLETKQLTAGTYFVNVVNDGKSQRWHVIKH